MTDIRAGCTGLRLDLSALEPDDAFVARLAALAAAAPTPRPRRSPAAWRVGLAAAGVAAIVTGGAAAAAALNGWDLPLPPAGPARPTGHTSNPSESPAHHVPGKASPSPGPAAATRPSAPAGADARASDHREAGTGAPGHSGDVHGHATAPGLSHAEIGVRAPGGHGPAVRGHGPDVPGDRDRDRDRDWDRRADDAQDGAGRTGETDRQDGSGDVTSDAGDGTDHPAGG